MLAEYTNKTDQRPPFKRNIPALSLMGGNTVSFTGEQIYLLALPLMVLAIGGTPIDMGIVAALERLPNLLQAFIGPLVDRFNRKKVMLFCLISRSILISGTGLWFITGTLPIEFIFIMAFSMGVLSQFYNSAQFAAIPLLVNRSDLPLVNSVESSLFNTAILIGPTLGGIIISLINPGLALIINSICFFMGFITILSLDKKLFVINKGNSKFNFWKELKEGFVFVFNKKQILYTNFALAISTFGTTIFIALSVFHMGDTAGFSAAEIGIILSFGGFTAIVGALSTNFLLKIISYKNLLLSSFLFGAISIILFGVFESFLSLMIFNAMGTFFASLINPCIKTIRQNLTPYNLLGRVQSTSRFITWSLLPLASLLAGVIAEVMSTNMAIILGGGIALLAPLLFTFPALRNMSI